MRLAVRRGFHSDYLYYTRLPELHRSFVLIEAKKAPSRSYVIRNLKLFLINDDIMRCSLSV
jgi:hypothetical protein